MTTGNTILKRILLVDDEEIVHLTISRILSSNNYELEHAYSGNEALNKLEKSYDLVICDVKMPGISGITVLKEIKNKHSNTKIIILSGYASKEDEEEALSNNALHYFTKPIENITEFKQFIYKAVS